jgi:hypothetical protein
MGLTYTSKRSCAHYLDTREDDQNSVPQIDVIMLMHSWVWKNLENVMTAKFRSKVLVSKSLNSQVPVKRYDGIPFCRAVRIIM